MATSVDYTGRLVDLFIFQGALPSGDQRISLSFGEGGGEITTGIQKLLQSYAILFLTERGSVPNLPDLGTDFVTTVRQGRIQDETDVKSEFLVASELIQQVLDLEVDTYSLPEDEQLESSTLESFTIDKAESLISLSVRVTSVAGETRTLFLPVPLVVQ